MTSAVNILQWNMDCTIHADQEVVKLRTKLLGTLVAEFSPTLVFLQETNGDPVAKALRSKGYETSVGPPRKRLRTQSITAFRNIDWASQGPPVIMNPWVHTVYVRNIAWPSLVLALWNIHLPSLSHNKEAVISNKFINEVLSRVHEYRRSADYPSYEIFSGDFNLQPYHGVFFTFNVSQCLHWAGRRSRTLDSPQRALFNPSWQLLSDSSLPLGTYYYDNSSADDRPWYVFDQTFVSPTLGVLARPKLISHVGTTSLHTTDMMKPNRDVGSDHFPVIVQIRAQPQAA